MALRVVRLLSVPLALTAPALLAAAPAAAQPAGTDWRTLPRAAGTWAYRQDARGSLALFGESGQDADLTLRCDRQRREIYLSRRVPALAAGAGPTALTIRTTTLVRSMTALPVGDGQLYVAVAIDIGDPLLDAMGFSRGRFVIEVGALPPLSVPPWAELNRVVEDCRS